MCGKIYCKPDQTFSKWLDLTFLTAYPVAEWLKAGDLYSSTAVDVWGFKPRLYHLTLGTHTETDPFRPRSKATILLSHIPGLAVRGDAGVVMRFTKLQGGQEQPQEVPTLRKATNCC